MTIHLEQIIHDIERMSATLGTGDRREWLRQARRLLRDHDRGRLATKITSHHDTRGHLLVPQPLGDLEERIPAPRAPFTHTVAAADGSNIAPERSSPVRFYVLNMGLVTFCYGEHPGATITSQAQLYYRPEDLYWDEKRQRPVDEKRLSLLMRVEEIAALPTLVAQVEGPCIALVDGQLILWALQGEEVEDRDRLLGRLMDAFEQLRDMRVPIVGYISDTESFELVNTLKIYLCPTSPDRCQQCHAKGAAEVQLCYHLN
nr:DNA double-strand break repair nuclease NurA [Ardenticatenales bacterium]